MRPTIAKLESSVWVNTADLQWFLPSKNTVNIFPRTIKSEDYMLISFNLVDYIYVLLMEISYPLYISLVHLQVFLMTIAEFTCNSK